MDFELLLSGKKCTCQKVHSCGIKKVIIEAKAINKLLSCVCGRKHILLVADENTYKTCGEEVSAILGDILEKTLIYQRNGLLIPNEDAVNELFSYISEKTDLIVGIGSGVIQDVCKYSAFKTGLPYGIIATAPSMDGYASSGAAMIMNHMKVTYTARVPEFIIGDINVLKDAPIEMIQSGYGDILGKYSCLNDWKLSKIVNGEYFCQYVYDLTFEMLKKTENLGKALLSREPEAIKILTEALIGVGIAMAFVGNSRPASGSEHHLSHFFEVVGIMNDEPYFSHGIDVLFSAVLTEKMREKLLLKNFYENTFNFNREDWESNIKKIYTDAADGIIKLQEETESYKTVDIDGYIFRQNEIKEVLKEAPSSEKMLEYVSDIGLDFADFKKLYGGEKIQNAIWYAKDLKDRYTVLWLYYVMFYNGNAASDSLAF